MEDYSDLLARLDVIVSCPIYVRGDQNEIRDVASLGAAAIRALLADRDAVLKALDAMTQLAKPGAAASMIDIERSIRVAVEVEREACAKVCDEAAQQSLTIVAHGRTADFKSGCVQQADWCAAAIRARGEP